VAPAHDFENAFSKQIQQCSRCGFCQAVCPVYGVTLRPSYNARGKMLILKEVMEKRIPLNDELIETLFQCTTCGHCEKTCPSGVTVPDMIRKVRKDMVGVGSCHPVLKGMNEVLKKQKNIYGETTSEDFGRDKNRKADVVYFVGCVGTYREKEATLSALKLLDRLQVNFTLIDEVCCSGALEDIGYEINKALVQENTDAILATGASTVITGCPYCFRTFTHHPSYVALKERPLRILPMISFLREFRFGVATEKRVTYHDPCDLGRHLGIYEEPREVIRQIAPNFVEMRHNRADALCCGAGGGVRGAYPKNSIAIARRRLQEAEEVGAEIILTECNSCVHNLMNAKRSRQNFRIRTTAQFINELMEEASSVGR
jgi:Fe-S oxidoreductase